MFTFLCFCNTIIMNIKERGVTMKFFLLQMKINGVKSIDKEIVIDFYNSTLTKKINYEHSHVKAIYGPNGAGKTGIVYAVEIYKNLVFDSNYLIVNNATGNLLNLINQNKKEFSIEMIFARYNDENIIEVVYSHKIQLRIDEDGNVELSSEELHKIKGKTINDSTKYIPIYRVSNGILEYVEENYTRKEELNKTTMNLLERQTLTSTFIKIAREYKTLDKFSIEMLDVLMFSSMALTTVIQNVDMDNINLNKIMKQVEIIQQKEKAIKNKDIFIQMLQGDKIPFKSSVKVPKSDFKSYNNQVENLTAFIKVFRDDLNEIQIRKEENDNYYECELIMIYKDGWRINEKYESAGIKKLISIYTALCDLNKGKIVFIDEFDSNIHDVLLIKLIDYAVNYAKGQLIFTTHNLAPMEILQKEKHSIDFLSNDSRLVSWIKNGHYSPVSLYRKGLIEFSPFNIEAFNFLGTFGDDKR